MDQDAVKEAVRSQPCLVCRRRPSDPAHIQTKGAGGSDTAENLMPLCRMHHSEQHQIGIKSFTRKHDLPLDISGIYPKYKEGYGALWADYIDRLIHGDDSPEDKHNTERSRA